MESMDNAEDMKEHNQSNEEAGGKVEIGFWKISSILSFYSSFYAMRVIRKFVLDHGSAFPACLLKE